jgi:hypothetical protein
VYPETRRRHVAGDDVRFAPMATKSGGSAVRRDRPEGDIADAPHVADISSSEVPRLAMKLRVEAVPICCASGCLESAALGVTTKKQALLA